MDSNEAALCSQLVDFLQSLLRAGEVLNIERLPYGDFIIDDGERLVFERKEINDFQHSMTDGRLYNQAAQATVAGEHMIYIVYPSSSDVMMEFLDSHYGYSNSVATLSALGHVVYWFPSFESAINFIRIIINGNTSDYIGPESGKRISRIRKKYKRPIQKLLSLIPGMRKKTILQCPDISITDLSSMSIDVIRRTLKYSRRSKYPTEIYNFLHN